MTAFTGDEKYAPSQPAKVSTGDTTAADLAATSVNLAQPGVYLPDVITAQPNQGIDDTGTDSIVSSEITQDLIDAIVAGQTTVTRRVELYESDGETPYLYGLFLNAEDRIIPRIIDGNIGISSSSDARRTLDLTLDNSERLLVHDPENNGLWYDKIVKVFRGIQFDPVKTSPSIVIVNENASDADDLSKYLRKLGFSNFTYLQNPAVSDLVNFDIVAAWSSTANFDVPTASILLQAYNAGFSILTANPYATPSTVPLIATYATQAVNGTFSIVDPGYDTPFNPALNTFKWPAVPGQTYPLTARSTARGAAVDPTHSNVPLAIYEEATAGARWFHYHPKLDISALKMITAGPQSDFEGLILGSIPSGIGIANSTIGVSNEQAHSGTQSLKITMTSATGGAYEGFSPVVAGQSVYHKFFIYPKTKPQNIYMGFYFYDASHVQIGSPTNTPAVVYPADTWSLVEGTKVAPAGAFYTQITMYILNGAAVGDVYYIDDLTTVANPSAMSDYIKQNMFLTSAINWLFNYKPKTNWECQIGEFMIDGINAPNFPHQIAIKGRDYAKKVDIYKFTVSTTYPAGTPVALVFQAIAVAAGWMKQKLDDGGATLTDELPCDQGSSGIDAFNSMKETYKLEWFADAQGYLILRPAQQPVSAPVSLVIKTGAPDGNLVTYSKSSDDSELYNWIVVPGQDKKGNPYFGEAKQPDGTPTSFDRVGVRPFIMPTIQATSDEQCQAYAEQVLAVRALESFQIDFTSLVFPWLEVGTILEFIDPDADIDSFPDRLLFTDASISLALGPMSGTGKRVSLVG